MGKRLAIVGSWPENRHLIPWQPANGDGMTEIWAFNEAPQKDWFERWDALFQLHKPEVYSSPNNFVNKEHWSWLQQKHGKPIYMQAVDPRVPDSVAYPLEGVLAMIPYRYLRSSIAFALALAIYQGTWDVVELYGINLQSNTEYAYQATNMTFWIGFAHGRGIDLQLKCWLDEFNQPLYGYEGEIQIDREFFRGRLRELETAWQHNDKELKRLKSDLDRAMLENNFQKVASLMVMMESVAMATGETAGAMGEAERYSRRDDPIPRQEFEHAAARSQSDGEGLRAQMYHAGGKCEYVWNVWKQTGQVQALNQLRAFLKEKAQKAFYTGAMLGVYRENIQNMREIDSRITAAGGVRTLEALKL
jgi:hypothetical protein